MTAPSCLVFAGFSTRHFALNGAAGLLMLDALLVLSALGLLAVAHGIAETFNGVTQIGADRAQFLGTEQQQDDQQHH